MATVCGGRSASCSSRGEARGSPLRFDFGSAGNGYSCNAQWFFQRGRHDVRVDADRKTPRKPEFTILST